jgi:hypothetical protein
MHDAWADYCFSFATKKYWRKPRKFHSD